jgi:phosphohistidine phosphatase
VPESRFRRVPRQVWLLRHGDAEPGDGDDAARRLTDKGVRQSRAAGAALAALGVRFDAVLASPRIRALDTARLAAEALGGGEVEVHGALSGDFDADDLAELLAGFGPDARLLLVGHEPDFSELVGDLTGGRVDLKKGGIAVLRLDRSGHGELVALLRPADLERMGAEA